jgi:GNAT superfamily N-acetyltransferase
MLCRKPKACAQQGPRTAEPDACRRDPPATPGDLAAADAVLRASFGVSRSFGPRVSRYLALQPDGWLAYEEDARVIGTVGGIDHDGLVYVGLMGVFPEAQGRGIGRRLLERLLAWADARSAPCVALDATEPGARLYEGIGFVDVALPEALGPWGARDRRTAAVLLGAAAVVDATARVLVPGENTDALALLADAGFTIHRTLRHMRRGTPLRPLDWRALYGKASYCLGRRCARGLDRRSDRCQASRRRSAWLMS